MSQSRRPAATEHARGAAPGPADGAFSHRQVLTVLAGLMAAMFLKRHLARHLFRVMQALPEEA